LKRLALGVALVLLARQVWLRTAAWSEDGARVAATALLLPGLSLILHFGLFNVAAGAWRLLGVDARPLFRAPLLSTSLAEFWGRRWNLAFSEMTAIGIYRPVAGRLGRGPATGLAFLASGLLHELAISVPVGAGYGLPMCYFLLHGGLTLAERGFERAGRPVSGWGWPRRVWVLGWLALPLPILFHPWFLRGVIWPLIGMTDGTG
jgi:alginate O-acetyltransferase complex protein AlgI